jgi:hypothetical protein
MFLEFWSNPKCCTFAAESSIVPFPKCQRFSREDLVHLSGGYHHLLHITHSWLRDLSGSRRIRAFFWQPNGSKGYLGYPAGWKTTPRKSMKTREKLVSLLTWPKVTQIYRETWPLNWPELVACWLRNCTSSLGYWGLNTWNPKSCPLHFETKPIEFARQFGRNLPTTDVCEFWGASRCLVPNFNQHTFLETTVLPSIGVAWSFAENSGFDQWFLFMFVLAIQKYPKTLAIYIYYAYIYILSIYIIHIYYIL